MTNTTIATTQIYPDYDVASEVSELTGEPVERFLRQFDNLLDDHHCQQKLLRVQENWYFSLNSYYHDLRLSPRMIKAELDALILGSGIKGVTTKLDEELGMPTLHIKRITNEETGGYKIWKIPISERTRSMIKSSTRDLCREMEELFKERVRLLFTRIDQIGKFNDDSEVAS